jgi:hypothetical protein
MRDRAWFRHLRVFLPVLSLWSGLGQTASPADAPSLEYKVKAAFLLNFTKFIEWPASQDTDAGAPFTICVLGENPFGPVLDQIIEGETVNGHKLAVRRIGPSEVKSCKVVYVARNEKNLPKIIEPVVLTVGEGDEFLRDGGVISFVIDNRRVRFDVNRAAAARAGLTLSSKLLNVARSVD